MNSSLFVSVLSLLVAFVSFLFFKIASEIYSSFVLHVSFCVHLLSLL